MVCFHSSAADATETQFVKRHLMWMEGNGCQVSHRPLTGFLGLKNSGEPAGIL